MSDRHHAPAALRKGKNRCTDWMKDYVDRRTSLEDLDKRLISCRRTPNSPAHSLFAIPLSHSAFRMWGKDKKNTRLQSVLCASMALPTSHVAKYITQCFLEQFILLYMIMKFPSSIRRSHKPTIESRATWMHSTLSHTHFCFVILFEECLKTAFESDHPGPARKLSSNLYDIYQCRVYSE